MVKKQTVLTIEIQYKYFYSLKQNWFLKLNNHSRFIISSVQKAQQTPQKMDKKAKL
jgi:hypothetical protein